MIPSRRFGAFACSPSARRKVDAVRRLLSSTSGKSPSVLPSTNPVLSGPSAAKTRAGSGKVANPAGVPYIKDRGPVSWPSLFLVGIASASLVAYYSIERERRLETAMGRVVSSESVGWTPNPDVMAPRKFQLTPWGWFPEDDGFGPCKMDDSSAGMLPQIYPSDSFSQFDLLSFGFTFVFSSPWSAC
jgi:hypothetical protein